MAPKKSMSKKKVEEPVEPAEPEDPITDEIKQTRIELTGEWFTGAVAKTIADNQAAKEAAVAAEEKRVQDEKDQRRLEDEKETWKQSMVDLRGAVEGRMKELTLEKEQHVRDMEDKMRQYLNSGMKIPESVRICPVILLYDTHTPSFHERYFVQHLARLLRLGGLEVWWDLGEGVATSKDRLHHRMEVANRASLIIVVGTKGYYASPDMEDEGSLLYSRTVGGYTNGVSNLQVMHIKYDDTKVPEKWQGSSPSDLSFSTGEAIDLPPLTRDTASWMERVCTAAKAVGMAASEVLESRAAFLLGLSTSESTQAIISEAKQTEPEAWAAANEVHSKTGLLAFQRFPVAEWSKEDMICAMAHLGKSLRPACRLFVDHGITGWLLDAIEDEILKDIGVDIELYRDVILRMVQSYRDPSREGGTMDTKQLSIFQLEGDALAEEVHSLFIAGDRDGNGTLDTKEFREVLRASRLALTQKEVRRIMAEVDENADGTIDYDEFMPVMVELIQGIAAQHKAELEICGSQQLFKDEAAKQIAGMAPEELDYKLRELFVRADADGNGYLTRGEFRQCLGSTELSLSRQQINVMMAEFDDDGDGRLTYENFLPIAIELLLETSKSILEDEQLSSKAKGLELLLNMSLKQLETGGFAVMGRVKTSVAQALLFCLAWENVVQLGAVHIASIIQAADPGRRGMVHCSRFSFLAAKMIDAIQAATSLQAQSGWGRGKRSIGSRNANKNGGHIRLDALTATTGRTPTPQNARCASSQQSVRTGTPNHGRLGSAARPGSVANTGTSSTRPHSVVGFGGTEHPSLPDRVWDRVPQPWVAQPHPIQALKQPFVETTTT